MDLSTPTADRLSLAAPAVPGQRQPCPSWCVDHTPGDDLCNAADIPIPGANAGVDPYVGLVSEPDRGPRIFVYRDGDELLSPDDAEAFARALLAQVSRVRTGSA
jgi:hypothetical protein